MRRALTPLAVASILFAAGSAFAKDDPPPPPPPPPPSDSADSKSDEHKDSAAEPSNSTDFKSTDALLDQSKGKHRPLMLSFFTGFRYPYYIGSIGLVLGARFNIPLVHDGFVPQINDSFDLEFGADFGLVPGLAYGCYTPVYVHPMIEPRYTVYLLPKLAAYVKPLSLGFLIWPNSCGAGFSSFFFHYEASVGVIYKLTNSIALRGEVGSYGIRAGIGISF
ncbi:MAG: hypothetical protein IPJ65_20855 [Archangiaceae bacterium]|nr:hypothetical protein [Archangiaceae bacterium]